MNQVRFGPAIAFIVRGLLCVAEATIVIAAVVWKSQALPKWSGTPLAAAGFAVLTSQRQVKTIKAWYQYGDDRIAASIGLPD